jgi:hypothetical protein
VVRSELSEGVQLADLCGYAIYRAIRNRNLEYGFFDTIKDRIYMRDRRSHGLKIHPALSTLKELLPQ